jgi:hypothetical protein
MRREKRFYMVEEDVRYYEEKFNHSGPGICLLSNPDFLAEFLSYADFIEKEFSYRIHIANFPQIFVPRLVSI